MVHPNLIHQNLVHDLSYFLVTVNNLTKGYCYVTADVDAQEMWIASLFSDQYAKMGELGSTGISYMTLSGTKESGTDIHTVTANAVGVDRNSAKILNYARIYLERFDFFF